MAGRIPKVVVVGPVYVDMAIRCDRSPRPGQIVEGSGFSCLPTGHGLNKSIQAALCGCEVHLFSKVGDDVFGQMILSNLKKHAINTDHVYVAPAICTGISVTMVDSVGGNSCCVSAGANRALGVDEVACAAAEQLISSADVCLIHGELSQDVVRTVIRTACLHKTKVVLEVPMQAHSLTEHGETDWPMEYFSVDILIPGFGSSAELADFGAGVVHKLKMIGSQLVAKGLACVVIRMDDRGGLIIDRQGGRQVPGSNLELVDHAGWQDAFAGALAACYAVDDDIDRAVRFAVAAGALARSRFGCHESFATREEIIELLQNGPE